MEGKYFRLGSRTLAVIDWANVYGWSKSLKWQVDAQKLFNYLKLYPEVFDIRFYFGVEKGNEKSENFQREIKDIGYNLVSKEVKWVPINLERSHFRNVFLEIDSILRQAEIRNYKTGPFSSAESFLVCELNAALKRPLYRRKCDFDVEITKDIILNKDNFDCLLLWSGDGDYKSIVEYLLDYKKQVIVLHPFNLRGKEFNELLERQTNRPFFFAVNKLKSYLK